MKVIVDKKSNLSRGFADLHTPSNVENELTYTWQERKADLMSQLEQLDLDIEKEPDTKKLNALKNIRACKTQSLQALGRKINKRLNLDKLIIDRLRQACSEDTFKTACFLAKEDKARILSHFSIVEDLHVDQYEIGGNYEI